MSQDDGNALPFPYASGFAGFSRLAVLAGFSSSFRVGVQARVSFEPLVVLEDLQQLFRAGQAAARRRQSRGAAQLRRVALAGFSIEEPATTNRLRHAIVRCVLFKAELLFKL